MRREAHFIHDVRQGDRWLDDYLYAMLADEWRRRYPDWESQLTGLPRS